MKIVSLEDPPRIRPRPHRDGEDIDRVFEPVPHDAEWRADLEYMESAQ